MIGFDPDRYSSLEDSPNPPSIVVRVLEGELRRNVVVTFSSQNGSAIGQYIKLKCNACRLYLV